MNELTTVSRMTKYPPAAFDFVRRGLDDAVRRIHGEPGERDDLTSRHVSGRQLCLGLRSYALSEYGLLARMVLRRWHINSTEDFGRIVFAMVEAGQMQKTEEDSLEDFVDVFDFEEGLTGQLTLSERVS